MYQGLGRHERVLQWIPASVRSTNFSAHWQKPPLEKDYEDKKTFYLCTAEASATEPLGVEPGGDLLRQEAASQIVDHQSVGCGRHVRGLEVVRQMRFHVGQIIAQDETRWVDVLFSPVDVTVLENQRET